MHSGDIAPPLRIENPLRVWSLIVTIFGDVVMRKGSDAAPGPIWTARLLDLLALLGVEAGLARTSLSRLVANGTLLRTKNGRNTFYRLSAASSAEFRAAAAIIYGGLGRRPTGRFHLALIDRCERRADARAALSAQGWRFISASTGVAPEHENASPPPSPPDAILAVAEPAPALLSSIQDAWDTAGLNEGYQQFIARFGDLDSAAIGTPEEAISARVQMVHAFRRLALRDPILPAVALPQSWRGTEARRLFDAILQRLEPGSEQWIATTRFRDREPA